MFCPALSVLEKSRKFIERGVQEVDVVNFLRNHYFYDIEKVEMDPKEAYPFNYKMESFFGDSYFMQISDFDIKFKRVKSDGRLLDMDSAKYKADWRAMMAERFEDYYPALDMYLSKREVILTKANEQTPIF